MCVSLILAGAGLAAASAGGQAVAGAMAGNASQKAATQGAKAQQRAAARAQQNAYNMAQIAEKRIQQGTIGASEALQTYGEAAKGYAAQYGDEAQRRASEARGSGEERLVAGTASAAGALGKGLGEYKQEAARAGEFVREGATGAEQAYSRAMGAAAPIEVTDVAGRAPGRLAELSSQFERGFEEDPGYSFAREQGEQAIGRSAAARGGRLGGATLKELSRFNQGLAEQQYDKYMNRRVGAAQGADAMQLQAMQEQAAREQQARLASQGATIGVSGAQAGLRAGLGSQLGQLAVGSGQQSMLNANQLAALQQQMAAQRAGVWGNYGNLGSANAMSTGSQLAGLASGTGTNLANIYQQGGIAQGNAYIGAGSQATQLAQSTMPGYMAGVPYAGSGWQALGQGIGSMGNLALQGMMLNAMGAFGQGGGGYRV